MNPWVNSIVGGVRHDHLLRLPYRPGLQRPSPTYSMVHVMSEITRYDCEEDRSCEYEVKAVMRADPIGYYVRHADHLVYVNEMRMDRDVERLRADTAEAYAKAVSKSFDDLAAIVGYSTERLGQTGESPMDCAEQIVAKLAAAEQRIAELVGLLQGWLDLFPYRGTFQDGPLAKMKGHTRAALNPKPEAGSHE